MTWNYRIVQHKGYVALHEVHYDANGCATRMTENPTSFVADSPEELRSSMMVAKMDAMRRPVFVPPEDFVASNSVDELKRLRELVATAGARVEAAYERGRIAGIGAEGIGG